MANINEYMQNRRQSDDDFAKQIENYFQTISERLTKIEEAVLPTEGDTDAD